MTHNMGGGHIVAHVLLPSISNAEHNMGMPASHLEHHWTEDEFYAARDAAPPGERWELVDGEVLVTPSPHWVHQHTAFRLATLLDAYVREHDLGRTFVAPLDVKLAQGLVLQPDVLIVPAGELDTWSDFVQHLLLAVETISPSSARHDRVRKRPKYQQHRVPDYWIVDGWSRTVECWHPDDERPAIISETLTWQPRPDVAPFTLDLPAFFAEVLPPGDP